MVQLGWKAGSEQYAPVELLEYALAAEKAGFDLLDASDHFHPWSEAGQSPFIWTWLGAAAVRTSKIQVGTGVTCPILRYNPALIAQAAATVSCFAPERTYLGVGTGEALNEYPVTRAWPEYNERLKRMYEAIQLIRALWSGQEVSFRGDYYQTQKAKLYTPPARPIPIYISVLAPHRALLAGKHGDGLFSVSGLKPEVYHQMMRNFEEGAREAGKDPACMPRLVELEVAYTENIDAAIQEQIKYWAGIYVPAMYTQKLYTPRMSQENSEILGPEMIKATGCFSSSPDDHIQFIQQYIELGFTTIILHSPGPDQQAFIESYSRDILPKIRTMT